MPPREQRTMVYVDGYNLYYGALKDTPYRWCDVQALCQRFLRRHQRIVGFKYFTARVKERPDNPGQALRQQIYLRALQTLPNLEVIYGQFLTHEVHRCLANPPAKGSAVRKVIETKEKGSDVNLATELLVDFFRARFDLAVVVSNDSDLARPIRWVRESSGRQVPVAILNPHRKRSFELAPQKMAPGNFYRRIQRGHLIDCQLPDILVDEHGSITKPPSWGEDQETTKRDSTRKRASRKRGSGTASLPNVRKKRLRPSQKGQEPPVGGSATPQPKRTGEMAQA